MIFGGRATAIMLFISCLIMGGTAAQASQYLQCVTYARQISGVQLSGNANTWWDHAEGVYDRGNEPRVGAVLAFRSSRAMRAGHVAMVSKVLSNREVLLNHANWSYRGGVEQDALAVDVSPEGDWSEVRVWYGPSGQLGIRSNPAYGFIYPEASSGAGNLTIASADLSKPAIRQLADNAGSGQRQKFKREEMDGNGRRNLAAIIDQVKKDQGLR